MGCLCDWVGEWVSWTNLTHVLCFLWWCGLLCLARLFLQHRGVPGSAGHAC
jgi:hypothetical protein